MPGTPKRKARMLGSYELLAINTAVGIEAECPPQYRGYIGLGKPIHASELGKAWQAAAHYTMVAAISVERLANLLRARASMEGESITNSYLQDDDFPFEVKIIKKGTPPKIAAR